MKIKLDDTELDCYDFSETSEGKQFSFRVDVQTEEERKSCEELLKKKYLEFVKEIGESIKVTVRNSSESYSIRPNQTNPDKYHFSIELEKFDREAEINKILKEYEDKQQLTIDAYNLSMAIRNLLIENWIITKDELNSKWDSMKKETNQLIRKIAEETLDKLISNPEIPENKPK